jgi:hypothetical protein
MRLPRWLVVSLMNASVIAILGSGTWWWVTWPERTMRAYRDAGEQGRLDEMKKMSSALMRQHLEAFTEGKTIRLGLLHPVPRTFTDVLLCRQGFDP